MCYIILRRENGATRRHATWINPLYLFCCSPFLEHLISLSLGSSLFHPFNTCASHNLSLLRLCLQISGSGFFACIGLAVLSSVNSCMLIQHVCCIICTQQLIQQNGTTRRHDSRMYPLYLFSRLSAFLGSMFMLEGSKPVVINIVQLCYAIEGTYTIYMYLCLAQS